MIQAVVTSTALAGAFAAVAACGARTSLDLATSTPSEDGAVRRGAPPLDCAEAGITYIYTIGVDTIGVDNTIYSFDPSDATFTRIGVLACPAPPGATPFSMAVDHRGTAYIVFSNQQQQRDGSVLVFPGDGELFKVSTKDANCEATSFVPDQHGFQTFGMGFVANVGDGGQGETLYVAADQPPALGSIDTSSFALTEISPFKYAGTELTGTGGGKLFGFLAPDNTAPVSYIVEIDTRSAGVLSKVTLPGVELGQGWAFGYWGGDFYTFTAPSGTTVVQRYRPSDGSITQVAMAPPGVMIVGAGVSTCAPQG